MTTTDEQTEVKGARRTPFTRRRIIGGILAVALLVAAVLLGPTLWVRSASSGEIYSVAKAPARPTALVLGAGLSRDGTPSPFLAARLDVAQQLLERGAVRAILVSGDNRTHDYDEPTAMRDYLVEHGVPSEKVVLDYAGQDTYDSCTRAHRIFGAEALTVVSQSYHVPRAVAICRAVGLDAIGVGDDTAKRFTAVWEAGESREWLAKIKAAWDVTTSRDPILGQRETTLDDALRAR